MKTGLEFGSGLGQGTDDARPRPERNGWGQLICLNLARTAESLSFFFPPNF